MVLVTAAVFACPNPTLNPPPKIGSNRTTCSLPPPLPSLPLTVIITAVMLLLPVALWLLPLPLRLQQQIRLEIMRSFWRR